MVLSIQLIGLLIAGCIAEEVHPGPLEGQLEPQADSERRHRLNGGKKNPGSICYELELGRILGMEEWKRGGLPIKTEPVTAGADATVYVRLLFTYILIEAPDIYRCIGSNIN